FVHSLVIAWGIGVASANATLSDGSQGGTWWESGAAVAYSTTSQRYLVVWRTLNYGIQGRFLDVNGSPIGGAIQLENPGCSRDPGVAWNSATDEFGVSYTAFCGAATPGAYAAFRHMPATATAPSGRASFGFSGSTFVTDIDVNTATHHYVMGWNDG